MAVQRDGTLAAVHRAGRPWLLLGLVGFGLRLVLWLLSEGTNDIRSWAYFGSFIAEHGFAETYIRLPRFNHPPLMGIWGVVAHTLSSSLSLRFPLVFKVPSLIAEASTAWLIFRIWDKRGDTLTGYRAFAAYAFALDCALISSYHGNTDALYFFFALLAAYLMEIERKPLLAGLALGAALNVKLIPLLFVLPLAARCQNRQELRRYVWGGAIAMTPFLVALLVFPNAARLGFVVHIFGYKSNLEAWGLELLFRAFAAGTQHLPTVHGAVLVFEKWYAGHGGFLLLVASALLALFQWRSKRRRFDAFELLALTACSFLVLGSGFGVQYVGCVTAALLVANLRSGVLTSWATGVYILLLYLHYEIRWLPLASQHTPIPMDFAGFAILAWGAVAISAAQILKRGWLLESPNAAITNREG